MTRTKRFFTGTIAGYGNIAANILFTLLSVPLALAYLDKEAFALWALAIQINGYLMLVELGMSNAINRFIADHKDNVDGGIYGSYIITSSLVFLSQGIIIASFGFIFSWLAPSVFSIPEILAKDFKLLLTVLVGLSGMSTAFKALATPLWAFQRIDIINIGFMSGTLVSLGGLWFGLIFGWGVMAFPIAQVPQLVITPFIYFWICCRNGYFPKKNHWGKPSWNLFSQIFHYGKDVFLIQIGNQMINASQIMIISRFIGLSAAATFAVSTKIYSMGMMFLANPISSAAPGLTELYVRNENKRFIERYWDLITLTLSVGAIVAAGISAGNRAFVSIWTHGVIEWTWQCDAILAMHLIFRGTNTAFMSLFGVTKNWRPIRHAYIVEGIAFIPLAILLSSYLGLVGILIASLAAHLLITTPIIRAKSRCVVGKITRIKTGVITALLIIVISAGYNALASTFHLSSIITLCGTTIICLGSIGITWRYIINPEIKSEIICRIRIFIHKHSNTKQ